jgi:hypothetical protein
MDADGHFTIVKHIANGCWTFSERIGLGQLSPIVPNLLKEKFGGQVILRTRKEIKAKNWRPIYVWQATNLIAFEAVDWLRPYLKIKRPQADLIMELRASKELPASERRSVKVGRHYLLNPEVVENRERIYQEIRKLNHTGMEEWTPIQPKGASKQQEGAVRAP